MDWTYGCRFSIISAVSLIISTVGEIVPGKHRHEPYSETKQLQSPATRASAGASMFECIWHVSVATCISSRGVDLAANERRTGQFRSESSLPCTHFLVGISGPAAPAFQDSAVLMHLTPRLQFVYSIDILEAVRSMSKPKLPHASITNGVGKSNLEAPAGWFGQPRCSLQNLVLGFRILWPCLNPPISDLLDFIEDMQPFTIVLDKHEGKSGDFDLALMADHRNWILYRLLSLAVSDHPEESLDEDLYRSCWLGASIYCLIVVFPYPACTAPFDKLAGRLRSAMIAEAMLLSERPELCLWLAFMGGLAAVDVPDD
jgi:hypothetical protein